MLHYVQTIVLIWWPQIRLLHKKSHIAAEFQDKTFSKLLTHENTPYITLGEGLISTHNVHYDYGLYALLLHAMVILKQT